MGLTRVGVHLFGVGLAAAALAAVVVGVVTGGTDVGCPGLTPTYGLVVDAASLSVGYTDGCNEFTLNPVVVAGCTSVALGVGVGSVGILTDRRAE